MTFGGEETLALVHARNSTIFYFTARVKGVRIGASPIMRLIGPAVVDVKAEA